MPRWSPRFSWRGSAAARASVYNLRLPPKASGEDTGAWPAPGFKGLRLTAGRRPTWVCVGLGRVNVKLSGAYWALVVPETGPRRRRGSKVKLSGAHLGPRLGQVGPMWSMLGTSGAHVEPMLGLCWPMLGLCWPMWA